MYKDLNKSIIVYGFATGISKSSMLILVPIFTRVFTPAEYGIIDLIFTLTTFVALFGMLQLESAVSRHYYEVSGAKERMKYVSSAFWAILVFSILLEILIVIFSKLIVSYFGYSEYLYTIIVATLIIPTSNLFSFLTVIMRFEKKPYSFTFIMLIQIVTTLAVSVWFVQIISIGIVGVFYGQIAGFIIATCTLIFYLKHLLKFYFSKMILIRFFKYSLPMLPAVAINWGNSYINRFVMLSYLTLAEIGLYTVALKIAGIIKLFEQAFKLAWGPLKWEYLTKPDHKIIYQKIMKYISVIVLSMVLIFSLFSGEILSIMATDAYKETYYLTGILAFSFGLNIIYNIIGIGPSIRKKTIYNTFVYFISLIINVSVLFILVPKLGLIGVPIALMTGSVALIIIGWINSENLYYIGFDKLYFAKIFIITIIFALLFSLVVIPFYIKILISIVIVVLSKVLIFKNVKENKK